MNSAAMRERHLNEWLWFVIALGVVLRVQGLGWDQGLLLNPDERNIGTAAARLAFPDHLVPDFNAYNGLALYLARLLAWLISPFTGTPGTDPAAIVLAGRILSAAYASLALPVLAAIARRAFGLPIALFVVACAVFSPGLIQSAHFATTESGLVLCLTVLIWLCQTYLRGETGHLPFAAQAGLALGIGFGLKTTALVFAVCPLVAVLVVRRESKQVPGIIGMGALAGAITLVLALITTPQLWAATHAYLDTMRFEGDVVRGTAEVYWTYQFEGAISGLFELSQLPWLLGPVVPALGLAAVVALAIAVRRGDRKAIELLPVLAFAIVYSVTICSWYAKFVRYLAPLLPVLMLFAGYFCAQLADLRMRKGVMVATGVATALVGLMQAALYQNLDPRIAAWDWLLPQLTAGDRIAVEPADVGPPYGAPRAGPVEVRFVPVLDKSSPGKIVEMADALAQSRWLIVASRRHYSVLPRLARRFPEMCGYYDALWSGRLGYQPVATFRRRPALPAAIDPTGQAEETFTVFDSPQVFVFAKTSALTPTALAQAIEAAPATCRRTP